MRREGFVPAVVYGAEQESINIKIGAKSFNALLHGSASEQILVNLEIEEEGTTKLALIQDVKHNALNGQIVHVDFHAVRENELIHASVPVELIGDCVGVRKGGLLDQQLHTLEIQCFPKDLPERVEGDVSVLDFGEAFHINQLTFPEGVSAVMEGEVVVALVAAPRVADAADAEEETPA